MDSEFLQQALLAMFGGGSIMAILQWAVARGKAPVEVDLMRNEGLRETVDTLRGEIAAINQDKKLLREELGAVREEIAALRAERDADREWIRVTYPLVLEFVPLDLHPAHPGWVVNYRKKEGR